MQRIANIGILAHVDAGKTTLTEQLLYQSGAIARPGRVDSGDTVTDAMALERARGITIRAAATAYTWRGRKINLLDTPGHMDFFAEVERALGVLDGAVLVISAKEGVQHQTRVIFQMLRRLGIPTLLFVNKVDRLGVDLTAVLGQIRARLSPDICPLQTVTGAGAAEPRVCPLPLGDLADGLIEADEALADRFLRDEPFRDAEIAAALARQTARCARYPVFFGAALSGMGVAELMDGINSLLPATADRGGEPLCAYVYKVDRDRAGNRLAYAKILAGSLALRDLAPRPDRPDAPVKVRQLLGVDQGRQTPVERVCCGDIAILPQQPELMIGDVLGRRAAGLPAPIAEQTAYQVAVRPAREGDRSALIAALKELTEEDPYLKMQVRDTEMVIHILGPVQLQIVQALLLERYDLSVIMGELTTVYRERPLKAGQAHIPIYQAPNPFAAEVALNVKPLPVGSGVVYESAVTYGYLTASFQNAVREGVEQALQEGLLGWSVTDVKVTLTDARFDSVNSTPADFRSLTGYALRRALRRAGTELLDPMVHYELRTPGEGLSRACYDIQQLRGQVGRIWNEGATACISGVAPAQTSRDYAATLASYTQGEGAFFTWPGGYAPYRGEPERAPLPEKLDKLEILFQRQEREGDA